MTRAIALLLLLTLPAHAGDDAPMTALVPEEWRVKVFEVTCQELRDCCGLHRACGGYATGPLEPAPVPLPHAGAMMLLGMAGLWRIRWLNISID